MYFFLWCFFLQLVLGDECGWSTEYFEWNFESCESVAEAYTNHEDEVVVSFFSEQKALFVKRTEKHMHPSMMMSYANGERILPMDDLASLETSSFTRHDSDGFAPITDHSGLDGTEKDSVQLYCNGLKLTAQLGVSDSDIASGIFNTGATSGTKALMEVFSSGGKDSASDWGAVGHVLTLNSVIVPRVSYSSEQIHGYYSSVELKNAFKQANFISLYIFKAAISADFWLYASPVVYDSLKDLKLPSRFPSSNIIPPLPGFQQRFFATLKTPRVSEISGDVLKALHNFTQYEDSCTANPLIRPVFDPMHLKVSYYNDNFNNEIGVENVAVESVLNIRVRIVGRVSNVRLTMQATCLHSKFFFTRKTRVVLGEQSHVAVDSCGVPQFMPVITRSAITKCINEDNSCSTVRPRTGAFGYCFGPMSYDEANQVCSRRGGRLPLVGDEAHLCCNVDSCTNGRQLIWVDGITGSYKELALRFADFFPYILTSQDSISGSNALTWFDANSDQLSPSNHASFEEAFVLEDPGYVDLHAQGVSDQCASVALVVYYSAADNMELVDKFATILPFGTTNGVFVTLYDVSDGDRVVDRGFSTNHAINYYAGADMSSPNFGVNDNKVGLTGLSTVHGDYKVFLNTHIWPQFLLGNGCCDLKVSCPGNECSLNVVGNGGSTHVCFDENKKSYPLNINYVRSKNTATDLSLLWDCGDSHMPMSAWNSAFNKVDNPIYDWTFKDDAIRDQEFFLDNIPEDVLDDDKWRIVPVGVLFSAGFVSESESEVTVPVQIEPSSMTVESENSFFHVCLPKKPKANVTVAFEGTCGFDKCSCTFGEEDWNVPQKVCVSPCKDTVINGQPEDIIMTCSSEDEEFDEVEHRLPCSFGSENVEPRKSVCHVNFKGYMFNSWDEFEYTQNFLDDATGCFDIFSGAEVLKVQGYLADCGTSNCLIGVSIVSGGEVVKFYKQQGDDFFSIDWKESLVQSDIFVEEWEGCWMVTTPDGCIITVCQNYAFLEVNIQFNELYTESFKNPDKYGGLCFPKTFNATENTFVIATSTGLNSFLQISEARQQKVSTRCGVESESESESVTITRDEGAGAMMKTVAFDAAYTTDYFVPLKLSDLDKGLFGRLSRDTHDIDRERLCSAWNEFLPSLELDSQFSVSSYKRFMYHYQKMRVTCGFVNDWFINSGVEKNPLFCLLGTCGFSGCKECDFEGCNPPLPGPSIALSEIQLSNRCTNSYSVIVSPATGWVIKCFQGMCEWSPNGFTWEGLPSHVDSTAYCLTAISDDFSTIWGWTADGTKIFSNDFGQTWQMGVYTADEKERFIDAHVDPYFGGSVGLKGNSHSVPDSDVVFSGLGEDKWWFTEVELCVSSNRLTSGKSMIYCVQWWCECLDFEEWGAAFGIDVLIGV